MNNVINKQKLADYMRSLNEYIRNGKKIVFIDETNFNLFYRRKQGWSRVGARSVQITPSSIGNSGVIKMDGVYAMGGNGKPTFRTGSSMR